MTLIWFYFLNMPRWFCKLRQLVSKSIDLYTKTLKSKEPGSLVEAQPTLWSGDDFERKTSSEEGVKGETISLVESDYMCVSKANTSSSDDGMQLILDHFNKGELIGLVKDLSEQLFEAKGELVEQEARLRAEMCDNMNQQMIDFEKKFEESRISEGLQSFLQHESSFQHQEVVERLQRRIYEIEEIFAMKHDALVESETAFCELKARYDDLSQRLIAQTNDLHQSTLKLEKVKQLHKEELEAHTNEAEKRIVELKVDLRTALEHNAALLSHIPDIDAGVQTIFSEPSILCDSTAVQTSICQVNELCVQTCLVDQGISVGVQTEKCNPTSTSKSASQTGGEVVTSEYEESNESNCTYKPDHRTIQGKRNLGNANRLRLKHNRGRPTQRLGPPKIPDLLSPIASSVCMSDSELELISTLADGIEKENLNSTSEEIEDDDDTHKSKSVLRSISTRTTRRNNAKKVNGTSTEPRKRRTVLAAAQRRLPHLAESSQLLPDSFFQDQLDEALEVVDAELRRTEHRKLRELPLRQGPRRRR
ncbi:unnamed protein product [Heterobilharzia americana]|nr:unnamed protein product [Heterobilharzia americana]